MIKPLKTLNQGQRFLLAEQDAIEYRYLWEACKGHTVADHKGQHVTMDGETEVITV